MCSFCRGNFLAFFFEPVLSAESRTDSIIEYEFGMTDHYLKKRMHTNLLSLQRISHNIMQGRYIDFMCVRINVTYIEICKCKRIIYAYPNGSALNKKSHSGNLYNIIAFRYRSAYVKETFSRGRIHGLEVNELLSFVSCRTANIDPFYEMKLLLFMELCPSGKESMKTF